MTGAVAVLMASQGLAGAPVTPFVSSASWAYIDSSSIASITFNADGTLSLVCDAFSQVQARWWSTTPAAALYIRATRVSTVVGGTAVTSGAFGPLGGNGAFSSWVSTAGSPALELESYPGELASRNYSFEVATDAAGTNVVATSTWVLQIISEAF